MKPDLASALALAAILTAGCSRSTMRAFDGAPAVEPVAFADPALNDSALQRVLILPLMDESDHGPSTAIVSASLRDEILKLRRFELVQPNPSDAMLQADRGPKKSGRIEVATLLDLGRRYGVDAVLFGAIDHYRPYEPPALAMSLSLIHVQSGQILWHVNDIVDAADHDTALSMRYFFEDEAASSATVFDHQLMATAPAWFARFAARRVAKTLLPHADLSERT